MKIMKLDTLILAQIKLVLFLLPVVKSRDSKCNVLEKFLFKLHKIALAYFESKFTIRIKRLVKCTKYCRHFGPSRIQNGGLKIPFFKSQGFVVLKALNPLYKVIYCLKNL